MKEAFDLIRKRLEEEIAWYETHGCDKTLKRGIVGATRKALSIVSEVEAEYGNGWIPCSERLPEVNTRVMCFTTDKTYVFGEYGGADSHYLSNKDVWFSDKGWYRKDSIIAWMPLPEPYKPEKGA